MTWDLRHAWVQLLFTHTHTHTHTCDAAKSIDFFDPGRKTTVTKRPTVAKWDSGVVGPSTVGHRAHADLSSVFLCIMPAYRCNTQTTSYRF